jgi:hypothetical protein
MLAAAASRTAAGAFQPAHIPFANLVVAADNGKNFGGRFVCEFRIRHRYDSLPLKSAQRFPPRRKTVLLQGYRPTFAPLQAMMQRYRSPLNMLQCFRFVLQRNRCQCGVTPRSSRCNSRRQILSVTGCGIVMLAARNVGIATQQYMSVIE